jgi:hypothetical protein
MTHGLLNYFSKVDAPAKRAREAAPSGSNGDGSETSSAKTASPSLAPAPTEGMPRVCHVSA